MAVLEVNSQQHFSLTCRVRLRLLLADFVDLGAKSLGVPLLDSCRFTILLSLMFNVLNSQFGRATWNIQAVVPITWLETVP